MFLAFLVFAQATTAVPPPESVSDAALYADCARSAEAGIPGAIDAASQWVSANGGIPARHCLGLAYVGAGKPAEAAATFEAAARIAEATGARPAAELYGQAGNAALLARDPARAERLLTSAITLAAARGVMKGELLIDRARAREALANHDGARADLETAVTLTPDDADGWLLLGALARREERLADARTALAAALRLAPDNPDVMLEAGNMAAMDGELVKARALWTEIVKRAGNMPVGATAKDALLRNPAQ